MMEEEKISEKFIQGFNHGYILQKFEPKLQSKLAGMENKGNYLMGLKAGGKKLEMELRMINIIGNKIKNTDRNKGLDLS